MLPKPPRERPKAWSTGSSGCVATLFLTRPPPTAAGGPEVPASLKAHATVRKQADTPFDAVLFEGDSDELQTLVKDVAQRPGPIVSVQGVSAGAFENGDAEDYALERLLTERSVSVNTAAAGGNANLMTIG